MQKQLDIHEAQLRRGVAETERQILIKITLYTLCIENNQNYILNMVCCTLGKRLYRHTTSNTSGGCAAKDSNVYGNSSNLKK